MESNKTQRSQAPSFPLLITYESLSPRGKWTRPNIQVHRVGKVRGWLTGSELLTTVLDLFFF